MKSVIFYILSLVALESFSQQTLFIDIDTAKISDDTIYINLVLKNISDKKNYFVKNTFKGAFIFCNKPYWYFFLKQGNENAYSECIIHQGVMPKRNYTLLNPKEEIHFSVPIKISKETLIKAKAIKEKYTINVIYKDSFLRHRNSIKYVESNIANFYY